MLLEASVVRTQWAWVTMSWQLHSEEHGPVCVVLMGIHKLAAAWFAFSLAGMGSEANPKPVGSSRGTCTTRPKAVWLVKRIDGPFGQNGPSARSGAL